MNNSVEPTGRKTPGWFLAIATIFGALTWIAAAGKFVDLVWFIRVFADNWREFFRDFWNAVTQFIRLPYEFTPNQRDCLTMIAACVAIGLRPSVFGFDSKPLFKVSINMIGQEARELNPWSFFWRAMSAGIVMMLFVMPFVDMDYFMRDVMALSITVMIGWLVFLFFLTIYRLVRSKLNLIETYRRFDPLPLTSGVDWEALDPMYRWFAKPLFFLFALLFFPILIGSILDPSLRVLVGAYLNAFSMENVVNIVMFYTVFGALAFAARKSVRPVFNIVGIGIVVLFFATSSNALIESYERNFPARSPERGGQ